MINGKTYKVFIDLGHGGNDPGAVGNGLNEKDIVLSIGLLVKKDLVSKGFDVMLSRKTDKTVTLQDRTNMANAWGADILVSIHCNGSSPLAYGIETFAYKEQYRKLADTIHNAMLSDSYLYRTNRGVKFADFHMLRESTMSACLVELGFITNIDDSQILKSKQKEYSNALVKGICDHFGITSINKPVEAPIVTPKPPIAQNIDVYYQAYANGKWLPYVKNVTDYAGISGNPIKGIRCYLTKGDIEYRIRLTNGRWLPWVSNANDYAGLIPNNIDLIQCNVKGITKAIQYRVRLTNGRWLPWVTNYNNSNSNGYAGIEGYTIDRLEMKLV